MGSSQTQLWFTMRRRCPPSLKAILMSQTLVSETFGFDWFVFVSTLFWKLKDCLIFSDRLVDGAQDGRQHWGSDWGDACRGEFVTNKQVSGDEHFIEMVDWWLHPYSHVWIVNIPRHWIWNACNRTSEEFLRHALLCRSFHLRGFKILSLSFQHSQFSLQFIWGADTFKE